MRNGEPTRPSSGHAAGTRGSTAEPGSMFIETTVSPFHCLYQDALNFTRGATSKRDRSEAEASRLARAALMLYLASAEALVHQAAAELGQPDLARLVCDPQRPMPLADAWRLLPAVVLGGQVPFDDSNAPPWPQFAELLAMRTAWAYPGCESTRRAYYRQRRIHPTSSLWNPTRCRRDWACSPSSSCTPARGYPATLTRFAPDIWTPSEGFWTGRSRL